MNTITLSNNHLRLTFDGATGALIGFDGLEGGWPVFDRPELGLSFRLLVPTRPMGDWHTEGRRNNPVHGEKQRLTAVQVADDGRAATFTWDGVTSEHAGPLPITVTVEVRLDDAQAVWTTRIENRCDYVVENVYCPYLGDLQPPDGPSGTLKAFSLGYADPVQRHLRPRFDNTVGYYGNDRPIQFIGRTPESPFCLLLGAGAGLYAGVGSGEMELVSFCAELYPGYQSAMDSRVPAAASIAGVPVAVRFAAIHVPHVEPGQTRTLTPIVLAAFRGGWQQGADLYKRWRDGWMGTAIPPAWAAEPHAWQQIHINSPEDELRMRFGDLVAVGEQCARHGIAAIQLVGWNDGGQDQGNPSHTPDPRLGTPEELAEAIRKIQAMGVNVVLFSKFTWADRATDAFRNTLRTMAIQDPYGDYHIHPGYHYQTATQMLDLNTKRLVPMCFLDERYLRLCESEFDKTVALGPAGILYDESQHHSTALQCFAAHHGHRRGAHVYANDRELVRRLLRRAPEGYLFAGEACYDWEYEVYHLSYFRTWNPRHVPAARYLRPHAQIMTGVPGFNDRNMINQCLLYRYVVSYEPYNFKGMLSDFPDTVSYGTRMDALRRELREWFWDGEFRDTVGGTATVDGKPHHPFSVFVHAGGGRRGMVVANYDTEHPVRVRVALDDGQPLDRYRLVDDPTWRAAGDGVDLPPASAAVILPGPTPA
ncbi:MAG: hypothetical protein GX591_07875 [Planctomycetes bacterium]|nr:hypothetical protein [Planctomycetota bacterium]